MTAVLRAESLRIVRASRKSVFTLDVPALELAAGEVLAILGRNGAGKSSLLRVLADLEAPAGGRVVRRADGPVTLVFQRPVAFAGSVHHNVAVALRAQRLDADTVRRRVDAALGHFGIARLAPRKASRLSGGELRRLALARAFALEPAVLLLDEPFDDLDAEAQESLSRDLRTAVDHTGVAVAIVTHDLRRAALVADRMAVLEGGTLRQDGRRDEVLDRPCDVDVARLVGMTNLVPAVVTGPGHARVDDEHAVPIAPSAAVDGGRSVWIGIRPEHLKVDVGRGEGESLGKATVAGCSDDGVMTVVDLAWAGHRLRTYLVAGRGLAREIAVGDTVSLSVRPADVHVLPRDDADGQ